MKVKIFDRLLFVSILTTLLFLSTTNAVEAGRYLIPAEQETRLMALEKVEAEFHPATKVVSVKGSIKNISKVFVRGYLSLHLLSKEGSVLETFELQLKENQPIAEGESVKFETTLKVGNMSNASKISIDFTRS